MDLCREIAVQLASFPAVLRELVEAELAAGNCIAAIESGFPAAPVGLSVKLTQPLLSRPRESGGGLDFYERNNSSYLGEITDAQRHFFVLEPPAPPMPNPDMDAIRAELDARHAASLAALIDTPAPAPAVPRREISEPQAPRPPATAVDRFRSSMVMNYERWHDGTGYDLDILKTCTPEEAAQIEDLLVSGPARDWRDVEALAALDTPRARKQLREALRSENHEVSMAVLRMAPHVVSESERAETLISALEQAEIFGGLTQAYDFAAEYHPPPVVEALLRCAVQRSGENAVHMAALLLFIHGKADSPFEWSQRPFFLRFRTCDRTKREQVFRELCAKIGRDPEPVLEATASQGGRKD